MGFISATTVARMLGIRTGTLAKWRRLGRGPEGAVHLSATFVVYPEDAVHEFIERRIARADVAVRAGSVFPPNTENPRGE